jgi:K+-transporting ATPase ATPase C chain
MVYASASGLDPELSLQAALDQVDSVSAARGFSASRRAALGDAVRRAAARKTTVVGPPRLNVVELNAVLETDPAFAAPGR